MGVSQAPSWQTDGGVSDRWKTTSNGLFLPTRSFAYLPSSFFLPTRLEFTTGGVLPCWGEVCGVVVCLPLELAPSLVVVIVVALQLLNFLAFSFWLLIVRIFPTLQYDTFWRIRFLVDGFLAMILEKAFKQGWLFGFVSRLVTQRRRRSSRNWSFFVLKLLLCRRDWRFRAEARFSCWEFLKAVRERDGFKKILCFSRLLTWVWGCLFCGGILFVVLIEE